jgi:hypothetical protein
MAIKKQSGITTASEQAKLAGLKSLAELAEMVRKPPQTLRNWHRDAPELFAVVVAGAVVIKAANVEVRGRPLLGDPSSPPG